LQLFAAARVPSPALGVRPRRRQALVVHVQLEVRPVVRPGPPSSPSVNFPNISYNTQPILMHFFLIQCFYPRLDRHGTRGRRTEWHSSQVNSQVFESVGSKRIIFGKPPSIHYSVDTEPVG
jgi:hypothetical protein